VIAKDDLRYPPISRRTDDGGSWYTAHPVTAQELIALMDQSAVDRTIIVQPIQVYGSDNSYLADSCAAHADRLWGLGVVDIGDAAVSCAALRRLVSGSGLAGVRLNLARGSGTIDPRCHPLLECADELGVPVLLRVAPEQLPQLPGLLRRFPGVAMVLDHCGFVEFDEGSEGRGAASLFEVGAHGNLYVKVSTMNLDGVGDSLDPAFLLRDLGRCFGADHLVWGSDFPHTHDRGHAQLVGFGRETARLLPGDGAADFLGRTAARLWSPRGEVSAGC
jgi:predicted TIM-barrel fold metal-dependent hydrolase